MDSTTPHSRDINIVTVRKTLTKECALQKKQSGFSGRLVDVGNPLKMLADVASRQQPFEVQSAESLRQRTISLTGSESVPTPVEYGESSGERASHQSGEAKVGRTEDERSEKRKDAKREYEQSESGKDARRKYNKSVKGRATQEKYRRSPHGRANNNAYAKAYHEAFQETGDRVQARKAGRDATASLRKNRALSKASGNPTKA